MPEGLEAEIYRRAAERCVGRVVAEVHVDRRQRDADVLDALLPGRRVGAIRRHGKVVLVELEPAMVLGVHFGMTGRLVVDGEAPIVALEYGSGRDDPAWDRLVVRFDDGGVLRVNDPRRWARFTPDPDLGDLGPDVLSLRLDQWRAALGHRRAPVKAVLLDQHAIAGFGNLCADEVLWHAGISPLRPAHTLADDEVALLARVTRRQLPAMLRRGGSHRGTISPEVRATVPPCPLDAVPLRRDTVGGRTTVWCPGHQH
jgi:formamidopyrimidine-DNA glycosylase